MAMNMSNMWQEVYEGLKEFLKEKSEYNPLVTKNAPPKPPRFPVVEIMEINNVSAEETTDRREQFDNLTYEVNIYTQDIPKDDEIISYELMDNELKLLVNEYMDVKLRMRRNLCQPIPNLDTNVMRTQMRYSCGIDKKRNIIIRR